MCLDSDLFGDVIVTLDDVELYLDNLPSINFNSSQYRREQYSKTYPVASIIKSQKLSCEFYLLYVANKQRIQVTTYQMRFVENVSAVIIPCNSRQCHCKNKSCEFKIAINRKKRNQRYYDKKYPQHAPARR